MMLSSTIMNSSLFHAALKRWSLFDSPFYPHRQRLRQCCRRSRIHATTIIAPSNAVTTTKKAVAANDTVIVDHATTATKSTLVGRAQFVPPRPIFPWRSLSDPLPRLMKPSKPSSSSSSTTSSNPLHIKSTNNNNNHYTSSSQSLEEYFAHDYFTRGGPLGPGWPSPMESWFRCALYGNSMYLLGMPWPKIIMPWTRHDWESDMGNGFCTAFALGVRGMMEDVYLLSNKEEKLVKNHNNDTDKIDDDEEQQRQQQLDEEVEEGGGYYDVDVDIVLDPLPLSSDRTTENNLSSTPKIEDTTADSTLTTTSSKREEQEEVNEEHYMLQRKLRQLYQSAKNHSHPSKVNILLRTTPQSAKIESMFPIYGLSRSLVDNHPHLRHTYRNMIKRLQSKHKEAYLAGKERLNPIEVGKFITEELQNVMEQSAKLSDNHMASITIVAQVSIQCKEIFCVRDVNSGVVLQGCGDHRPRDVTHLVRFEMVVRERLVKDDADESTSMENEEDGKWEIEMGRWQITDWDDLLDGNVFFR